MVCVSDFPESCLKMGVNLAASTLVANREGKSQNSHSLESRILFNLPIFFFFFNPLYHFSPLLCLLSLSPVSGRDRIVFLHQWERVSGILSLTQNFNQELLVL